MKGVLIVLSVALLYVESVPSPQYSIQWSSSTKGVDRTGADKGKERGKEWGTVSNWGGSLSNERRDNLSNERRDGDKKGESWRDDVYPRVIGRQGLGYEKRNFRSLAMRFPITPEIVQTIGYRRTLKDQYYEPLPRY